MYRILIATIMIMPGALLAQDAELKVAAERARQAWFAHDASALVADSPRLLIQLPGAEPSVALGPDQAAALLSDFVASGQEV